MSEGPSPANSPSAPAALAIGDLRRLIPAVNIEPAFSIFDSKLVLNPSRSGLRLYAEVKGSGQNPYKVTVDFVDGKPEVERARCNCPAARFQGQGTCKHAAAVLVAWSSAPASFAVMAQAPPEEADRGGSKKRRERVKIKTGTADVAEQASKGLAALEALLGELASSGLSTLTVERANQVREISQNLRPYKLRRLAPACMRFANTIMDAAVTEDDATAEEFAARLSELTFHVRGLRRLLSREDTEADDYKRLADELLGRTWTAKHLTVAPQMRLLDLHFSKRMTEDDFVVEQSLLADIATGELFCDKAIRPAALAKRQPPKEDFGHHVLDVAGASIYPGYAPRRIKLGEFKKERATEEDIRLLLSKVAQSAAELYASFQSFASDVFAPRPVPALMKTSHLVAARGKVLAADESSHAVELEVSDPAMETIESELERAPLLAIGGALDVRGGVLSLAPFCVITGTARAAAVADVRDEPVL